MVTFCLTNQIPSAHYLAHKEGTLLLTYGYSYSVKLLRYEKTSPLVLQPILADLAVQIREHLALIQDYRQESVANRKQVAKMTAMLETLLKKLLDSRSS